MKRQISVADLLFGAGGVLAFLFSFFTFFDYPGSGYDRSAWGSGNFPITTIPAVLALFAALLVIFDLFGVNIKLPPNILTLTWPQIRLTWGITSAVLMLGFLIEDRGPSISLSFAAWVMLIGSLAMAAGSIMNVLGKGRDMVNLKLPTTPPPSPPSPPGGSPNAS